MKVESGLGIYHTKWWAEWMIPYKCLKFPRKADLSALVSHRHTHTPSHIQTCRERQLWDVIDILTALLLFHIINMSKYQIVEYIWWGILIYSSGWPGTYYLDQVELQLAGVCLSLPSVSFKSHIFNYTTHHGIRSVVSSEADNRGIHTLSVWPSALGQ